MHDKTYDDSKGTLSEPEPKKYTCIRCRQNTATCQEWESSCGGYEDYKYTCHNPDCGHVWWIDGPDA